MTNDELEQYIYSRTRQFVGAHVLEVINELLSTSIADTAGANCATCGAVGTVTSTKARCTLCGMFADTAGAKQCKPKGCSAIGCDGGVYCFTENGTVKHLTPEQDAQLRRAIESVFESAAPPAPSVDDAKCMCSGLGPCEKLSNCRKAPSVADAAGASERRFEVRQGGMTVAATEGPGADAYRDAVHYFWQYQQDAIEDEPVEMVELTTVMRIDAIEKESGND